MTPIKTTACDGPDATIDVPAAAFIEHAVELAHEFTDGSETWPHPDTAIPHITPGDVTRVRTFESSVTIRGELTVDAIVGVSPASGPRGEPPINPPEAIREPRTVAFEIDYQFDTDFGRADLVWEPLD